MCDQSQLETQISKDFLTCPICFESYKSPKSLPCLHSFCEQCISKHIQSRSSSRTKDGFRCPICRQMVNISRPLEDITTWAGQLQDNFMIKSLLDTLGLQDSPDGNTLPPICMQHGNKLELVCVSCDTVPVCTTCVAVSHRMCTQVYTVATAAQERRNTLSYLLGPIEDRLQRVDCRQQELVKEKNLLAARKVEALEEMSRWRDEALQTIDEKFRQLVAEVREKCEECEKAFDKDAELLKDYKTELEKCQINAETVLGESDMSVVNKYYEVKGQIQEIMKGKQDAIVPCVPEYILSFEVNANFPAKLNELSLGTICVTKRERRLNMLLPVRTPSVSLQISLPSPSSQHSPVGPVSMLARPCTTVKFINKVSAKVRGDSTMSCLRDVTVVSGNIIVVTDGDNMAVKSFYTQGLRLQSSQHKTGRLPHGITTLAGNTVAVMVPRQKEMLLLDVTPVIMLQRKIRTFKSYYAVAALSPERLAVSTCPGYGPPSIDIIDTDGQLIQVVRDATNVGNLLSNPMSMCATPQGDIIITDPTLPSIVCIRQNGYKVFEYEPTNEYKMKTPYGVAIDKQGAILIADRDSNSIVLLSPEGVPLRRLITKTDKMESKPKAVAIGERGTIVTIHDKKMCVFEAEA